MSKRSITWHEECLKNMEEALSQKQKRLTLLEQEVGQEGRDLCFYQAQIKACNRRNKDGFDSDKFMRKVKK